MVACIEYRLDRHFGSKPEIGLPALGPLASMHPRELCRNMGPGQDQLLPLFSHLNSGGTIFMTFTEYRILLHQTYLCSQLNAVRDVCERSDVEVLRQGPVMFQSR